MSSKSHSTSGRLRVSLFSPAKQYQRAAVIATVGIMLAVAIACAAVAASATSTPRVTVSPQRVTVAGLCPSEDSCSVDYTRERTWIIRRATP
jgi:hypothetical protein